MPNNGRMPPDDSSQRDRMFDDRDEGSRHGDRSSARSIDRGGMGQSGYGSGRDVRDASQGTSNRNQSVGDRSMSNNQDDRFSGRGGDDYQRSSQQPERAGYRNDDQNDRGWGGQSMHGDYGQADGERGVWQGELQRGTQRGSNRQSTGSHGQSDNNPGRNQFYGNQNFGQGTSNPPFGQPANPMGLHRGKGPQGWTRSDERIKDLVCEALTDDEHIDASGIDVDVKSGEVTLSGMVPDRHTKRAAEDCAERISGVKDVTNQLKISSDERMRLGHSTQIGKGTNGGSMASSSNSAIENGSSSKDKKAQA